jgi:hypothetical protein
MFVDKYNTQGKYVFQQVHDPFQYSTIPPKKVIMTYQQQQHGPRWLILPFTPFNTDKTSWQ